MYIQFMGFETAHASLAEPVALNFAGYKQHIAHMIKSDPDKAFTLCNRVLAGLQISSISLQRGDLPAVADPAAKAKTEAFVNWARAEYQKAQAMNGAVTLMAAGAVARAATGIGFGLWPRYRYF
jgi:hypothetical protein